MRVLIIVVSVALLLFVMSACDQECVHEFETAITVQPGCAQMGIETVQCKLCEYNYTNPIPTIAHTYGDGIVEKTSTCVEEGTLKYTCVSCGDEITEALPLTHHIFGAAELTNVPNCTETGDKISACQICGTEIVVAHLGKDPNNHAFVTTVIRETTCEQAGQIRNDCTRCNMSQTLDFDPLPHQYSDFTVVSQPTCTGDGLQERKCSSCGHVEQQTLSKLDHSWDGSECGKPVTCTVCGYYNSGGLPHAYYLKDTFPPGNGFIGRRWYSCSRCGKSYFTYFGKHGDYDLDWVVSQGLAYGESLGFTIDRGLSYTIQNSTMLHFYLIDMEGGQVALLALLKDKIYEHYQKRSANEDWPDYYYLNAEVVYGENSTYASYFYIYVYTRRRVPTTDQNITRDAYVPTCIG